MKILVVEDEMTIAMMIEDMLADLGHEVVAVAMRLPAAKEAATNADIDMAILDVNLAGLTSFGVAELLSRRGVPFAFATGYGEARIEEPFRSRPILRKPFRESDLAEIITRVTATG